MMGESDKRLTAAVSAGFYLLLLASVLRMITRHGAVEYTVLPLTLSAVLAVLYGAGVLCWEALGRHRVRWLLALVGCWLALTEIAPSFSWCAIPLFFVSLRVLPHRFTAVVVLVLTVAVISVQIQVADRFDPSLVLAPIGVAAMTSTVFVVLERLIDDLTRTRGELATAQRAAGVLAERERLAREIHDSLAQGLTSMGMLLQAADRAFDHDPARARALAAQAAGTASASLEDARRFLRGLNAPEGSLPDALRALAGRGLAPVEVRTEGAEYDLPPDQREALLRVAQGALANAAEHATAERVVITLSYLDDTVTLDVYDDGSGFDRTSVTSAPGRGFGLRAMRDRLDAVAGTLTVETAPGEGTTIAATVPRRTP
ncbi:signal transduction histidine kinase [Actinocorallia herbida]|uniref:Oxygen sensor histidine kinase NreB n=1 Tax=Actinocorallia herbida TaxID=58109 RepID=A0A3N1CVW6_9ACTN|nr:sensor histidine kinase [Actinocorallia herbida]ROO85416.1 signal transduction histidine kinase [Actinocorallia herbida]